MSAGLGLGLVLGLVQAGVDAANQYLEEQQQPGVLNLRRDNGTSKPQ